MISMQYLYVIASHHVFHVMHSLRIELEAAFITDRTTHVMHQTTWLISIIEELVFLENLSRLCVYAHLVQHRAIYITQFLLLNFILNNNIYWCRFMKKLYTYDNKLKKIIISSHSVVKLIMHKMKNKVDER